jgi:anthranilate 1,2-dioxygenase small subunit
MSYDGNELFVKTGEVTTYLNRLSHLLDDCEIAAFVDEFTDDGTYRLIPRNNLERGYTVHIINDDKPRMMYRRDLILRNWHLEKFRATRVLSNMAIDFPTREEAQSVATFVIYQTNADGICNLHLVGKFRDRVVFRDGRWRIKDRLAILDNHLPDEAVVIPP